MGTCSSHPGKSIPATWSTRTKRAPVDLYWTIIVIDDARKRMLKEMGGSQIILSPVGSKALALGTLMAALERDFAVVLVKSLAYNAAPEVLDVHSARRG
jgi:hypothetical protein